MNRLIKAIVFGGIGLVLVRLWFQPITPQLLAELAVTAAALGALALVVAVLAALWRAARRVRVETVARTAGALTGKAERHVSHLPAAFKDGRRQ